MSENNSFADKKPDLTPPQEAEGTVDIPVSVRALNWLIEQEQDRQLASPLPRKEEYEAFTKRLESAADTGKTAKEFFYSENLLCGMKGQTMDMYDSRYASRKEVISIQPGDRLEMGFLACNSETQHFSKSLPANNVIICIDGIEVVFKLTEGKFNVEYDKDKITESAEVFFECLKDYFGDMHSTETTI